MQLQLWILVRQRDATREAAVNLCHSVGKLVSRDLLATARPPVAACGEVKMTREERMRALGCMVRAVVMHKMAHGAGMPGAFGDANSQKLMVAMMKRDTAVRAPPFHPCHPFPFSCDPTHSARGVILSPDHLTVTLKSKDAYVWARSERGVGAGCGVVRWAVHLNRKNGNTLYGGHMFMFGVASDAFKEYTEERPKQSWHFEDACAVADGQQQGSFFYPWPEARPFAAGDVVTVEMERAPGVDGVLRMRVAGRTPQELRGLPRDGTLYPIVSLHSSGQSCSMVALP